MKGEGRKLPNMHVLFQTRMCTRRMSMAIKFAFAVIHVSTCTRVSSALLNVDKVQIPETSVGAIARSVDPCIVSFTKK